MEKKYLANLAKSYNKLIVVSIFLILSLLMANSTSFAHKVNIFAYVEGGTVCTESYFPDGKKVENGTIEVYDNRENKLLVGKTNKEGQFNFRLPGKGNLKIVLIASMGHRTSYNLSVNEQPDIQIYKKESKDLQLEKMVTVDLEQIKGIIDSSMDRKLKPIMREIITSQQKKSFTEIIGGIGYIFGIMGIILYFLRKKGR